MSDPKPHITDHALIRYLEHSEGIDMDAVRAEISKRVSFGVEHGASRVHFNGLSFLLSEHVVVTCVQKNSPSVSTGMAKGKRGFVDAED